MKFSLCFPPHKRQSSNRHDLEVGEYGGCFGNEYFVKSGSNKSHLFIANNAASNIEEVAKGTRIGGEDYLRFRRLRKNAPGGAPNRPSPFPLLLRITRKALVLEVSKNGLVGFVSRFDGPLTILSGALQTC